MMKRWSTTDTLAAGFLAGLALLTASLYDGLPEQVPTHFDARGNADDWMPRPYGAWILPAVALGVWALLRFGGLLLPQTWRARLERSPMDVVGFLLVALFGALQCAILYAAIRGVSSLGAFLGLVVGIIWVALGLVLPRVRRNPFVGIRTTWTLTSDENWARTHRFGSYSFVLGGLLAIVLALAGVAIWPIASVVISAILPAVYSFVLARQLGSTGGGESRSS